MEDRIDPTTTDAEIFYALEHDPSSIRGDRGVVKQFQAAKIRLEALLHAPKNSKSRPKPENLQTLTPELIQKYSLPNYITENCVHRVQRSGNCFVHAAIVAQHYNIAKCTGTNARMLDQYDYVRDHMPTDLLYRYLFKSGGNAAKVLDHISDPKTQFNSIRLPSPDLLQNSLRSHGPGLITGFRIYGDFKKTAQLHNVLSGIPTGMRHGTHSMVLLGTASEGTRHTHLVQNSWATTQFVEIEHDYFTTCLTESTRRGSVVFSVGHQDRYCTPGCGTVLNDYQDCELDGEDDDDLFDELDD